MRTLQLGTLLLASMMGTSAMAQDSPGAALDAAWVGVCAGATPDSAFFARCQEIINAGPGSGSRRSEAAQGNNLGTLAAQAGHASQHQRDDEDGSGYRLERGDWGLLFNLAYGRNERDGSEFESAYDEDQWDASIGFDRRFGDRMSAGLALQAGAADTDFDGDAGSLERDTRGLIAFAQWQLGDNGGFEAWLGEQWQDIDMERAIRYQIVLNAGQPTESQVSVNGRAIGSTDARLTHAGAGWRHDWNRESWQYGLDLGLRLQRLSVDGYRETDTTGLALVVEDQDLDSTQARIGGRIGYAHSMSSGVLNPYLSLHWVHEFEDDSESLAARFAGDVNGNLIRFDRAEVDSDWAEVSLGLAATFAKGRSLFVALNQTAALDDYSRWQLSVGGRIEWP